MRHQKAGSKSNDKGPRVYATSMRAGNEMDDGLWFDTSGGKLGILSTRAPFFSDVKNSVNYNSAIIWVDTLENFKTIISKYNTILQKHYQHGT